MNRHFEDARYYLKRAGETTKRGVEEELAPIRERFRKLAGREDEEPEPSRVDRIRGDLGELEARARGEARKTIESARGRVRAYRAGN